MLQSVATLLFAALALVSMGLISALLMEDWAAVQRALGVGEGPVLAPVARRARLVAVRHTPVLRIKPGALRRVA